MYKGNKNAHIAPEFDQYNTQFLVQETINPREVRSAGIFAPRLDERWCDCCKFKKLHMSCSHVVYTLESVSDIYRGFLGELCNEENWSHENEYPRIGSTKAMVYVSHPRSFKEVLPPLCMLRTRRNQMNKPLRKVNL